MNWKLVVGNTLFSTGSAAMTMMFGNGMEIIDVVLEDVINVSAMMGFLYFIIAVGRDLMKDGDKIEEEKGLKSMLRINRKKYNIENTHKDSNTHKLLDYLLPF